MNTIDVTDAHGVTSRYCARCYNGDVHPQMTCAYTVDGPLVEPDLKFMSADQVTADFAERE